MGIFTCFRGFPAPPAVNRRLEDAYTIHRRLGLWPTFARVPCEGCGRRVKRTQHYISDYFKATWPVHVCPNCGDPAPHSHYVHLDEGKSSRSTCMGCGEKLADAKYKPVPGGKRPLCGSGSKPPEQPKPEPSQQAGVRGGRRAGAGSGGGKNVLRWQDQLSKTHPKGWPAYLKTRFNPRMVERRLEVPHYGAPLAASNRQEWIRGYLPWLHRAGIEPEGHPKMSRMREHFPNWKSLSGHKPEQLRENAWAFQCGRCVGDYCVFEKLHEGVSHTHHLLEKAAPKNGGHSGPNEPWNIVGYCPVCHGKEHLERRLAQKLSNAQEISKRK